MDLRELRRIIAEMVMEEKLKELEESNWCGNNI